MPTLRITIKMDNAAFEDYPMTEAGRILRQVARDLEKFGGSTNVLLDINGNTVGKAEIVE
jgi:hypothetical protein